MSLSPTLFHCMIYHKTEAQLCEADKAEQVSLYFQ
jgi:hypothetical protein